MRVGIRVPLQQLKKHQMTNVNGKFLLQLPLLHPHQLVTLKPTYPWNTRFFQMERIVSQPAFFQGDLLVLGRF